MISSAKTKKPRADIHPRRARNNYEYLENSCCLQNDRHHRTEHQSQRHHDRHDERSSFLSFLPIPHLLYLFSRKIKPQRTNPCGLHTKSPYILHCIQFAQMCNCQAPNAYIFSHRACRLPFCSPLAAYRAAAAEFPARHLSQTASSRTETRRTPSRAIRSCILVYFFVSFCCFPYCNSTSASV